MDRRISIEQQCQAQQASRRARDFPGQATSIGNPAVGCGAFPSSCLSDHQESVYSASVIDLRNGAETSGVCSDPIGMPASAPSQVDFDGLSVLDGAMATLLESRGFDLSGPLWSAHVLEDDPDAVAAAHREYLDAGADCLTAASYQISFEGFADLGRGPEEAATALRTAVSLAVQVRSVYQREVLRRIWVAAGLGPYGAWLHNGAEYRGDYECGFDDLVEFHSRRLAVLQDSDADLIAFETVPSLEEARAIAEALARHPAIPAWVSFSCRDGAHVSHGETLAECAQAVAGLDEVVAVGVNCTAPRLVPESIAALRGVTHKYVLVYPNSGEGWDAQRHCWTGASCADQFGRLAREWRALGADWIGGCCRTGPEHIRSIRQAI